MRRHVTALLSALTLGAAGLIGTGSPALADTAGTAATRSFSCEWEPGSINFSWERGLTNTRIYVNNHCSAVRYFTVTLTDAVGGWNECWRVPTGKSSKQFHHALTGRVVSILRHC